MNVAFSAYFVDDQSRAWLNEYILINEVQVACQISAQVRRVALISTMDQQFLPTWRVCSRYILGCTIALTPPIIYKPPLVILNKSQISLSNT